MSSVAELLLLVLQILTTMCLCSVRGGKNNKTCNISTALLTSRTDNYVRVKKLVKEELNGLIVGTMNYLKRVLKAQSKYIPSIHQMSSERANECQLC